MTTRRLAYGFTQLLAAAVFWARGEAFLAANGPTFDEAVHLAAGHSYWATGDFRLNVEDPPLPKLLWAAPGRLAGEPFRPDPTAWEAADEWTIGNDFLYADPARLDALLTPARRVNLLFGVGVVLLAGTWARQLWGSEWAGLLSTSLAAFDPTLLALAGVLSSDASLTFFTLMTAYTLWRYTGSLDHRWVAPSGVALGLTLGSKFSAVASAVGLLAGVLGFVAAGGSFDPAAGGFGQRLRSCLTPGVRVTTLGLLTLACLYFVVYFPEWGRGLKQQLDRGATGDPHFYFLDEVRTTPSQWYFLVALGLKLPLGTLALAAAGAARAGWSKRWPFVILPPAVFLLAATAGGVNLGVRVVLPVVPFVCLLAGGFATPGPRQAARRAGCALAVAFAAASSAREWSYPLSYSNELAPTPDARLRLLGDSNLDWGQGMPALKKWMTREGVRHVYVSAYGTCPPRVYGIEAVALPGFGALEPAPRRTVPADAGPVYAVVFASNLQGIYLKNPHTYDFLRSREPHAVIAGSVWVYDVTDDADARARLDALAATVR